VSKCVAGFFIAASIVAAWIACVKLAVPPGFKVDPTTELNRFATVQRESLARTARPSIVVLGTSRAAFGIDPETIEKNLSLPARSVVNAAYPGFYDEMLERFVNENIAYLQKAWLVVIVLDDYFAVYDKSYQAATSAPPAPAVSPWTAYSLPTVSSLFALAANTIRTWPQPVRRWDAQLAASLPGTRKELYWTARRSRESIQYERREYLWPMTETGRWKWTSDTTIFVETPDSELVSRQVADQYFKNLEFQQKYVGIYHRIIRQLNGVKTVALRMPPALSYSRYRDAVYGELHRTQSVAFNAAFQAMETPVLECTTAAACGLDERIFSDPMHMNREGAQRLSLVVANMLRGILETKSEGRP
jgi:hypothetical protein